MTRPQCPEKVVVIGNPGSGKTTAARRLARSLDAAHLELDSVYHQADWRPLPAEELRARVRDFCAAHPRWVVDGNYSAVREVLWTAADTVVWLDIPRLHNVLSISMRTARRFVTRTELWNGNREPVENWTRLHDPERSILAWAWTRHPVYRREYARLMADPTFAHLRFLRATNRAEVECWADLWQMTRARSVRTDALSTGPKK